MSFCSALLHTIQVVKDVLFLGLPKVLCNSMVLYGNSLTLGNASDWGCLDGRSR